ncbi:MAG: hypothetical protein ACUVWQ_07790 [Candidatus Aminicenantales bacterium]
MGELSGLQVVAISDAAKPQPVGRSDVFRGVQGLEVSRNFAYVFEGNAGVKKIDMSQPLSPKVVATFATAGESQAIVWKDPFVFVADSYSLLILK